MDDKNAQIIAIEQVLKNKEEELESLREKERSAFYSDIRRSLISIFNEIKSVKAITDDYKIFKAQIKVALLLTNIFWFATIILLNWFLKK